MKFVSGGPDIPESFLLAHEAGQVVFVCGTGVSYPAGYADVAAQCQALYEVCGTIALPDEARAFEQERFDRVLSLLEQRYIGGRQGVREAFARVLAQPPSTSLEIERALLTLSWRRDGAFRLVATSVNRLFENAFQTMEGGQGVERFQAPLLPPGASFWQGMVYLHGLLPEAGGRPSASVFERLILSSADLERAYLAERWATRFIAALARQSTLCLVGYELSDPVLHHLVTAMGALRSQCMDAPALFVLDQAGESVDETLQKKGQWQARGVTPIFYEGGRDALQETLTAWASFYRKGVEGYREQLVSLLSQNTPPFSDEAGQTLCWLLREPSGEVARFFAHYEPRPSLAWLDFLMQPEPAATSALFDPFGLQEEGVLSPALEGIQAHLTGWLERYFDSPSLLLKVAREGGRLGMLLAWRLELALQGNALSFDAAHWPMMRTLWQLVLLGRLKGKRDRHPLGPDLCLWDELFHREGLTPPLRLRLRELLTPRVQLSEPVAGGRAEGVAALVQAEVVLEADHVEGWLMQGGHDPAWEAALPLLLDDAVMLMRDALELMQCLGQADEGHDLSYLHQPFIGPHERNRGYCAWAGLIGLLREAWLATARKAPARALRVVQNGWMIPYPFFKRFAFFAAAQGEVVPVEVALEWLLTEERRWLWHQETEHEVLPLLVALAPRLTAAERLTLEEAILAGPPTGWLEGAVERDAETQRVDEASWQRLIWLGERLEEQTLAGERLRLLQTRYPAWICEPDKSALGGAFPEQKHVQGSETGVRAFRRRALVEKVARLAEAARPREIGWKHCCRSQLPTAVCVLLELAHAGIWPQRQWREAINVWSNLCSRSRPARKAWRRLGTVVADAAPDDFVKAMASVLGRWLYALLETGAAPSGVDEAPFIRLMDRILALSAPVSLTGGEAADWVEEANRHPVGIIADVLLRWVLEAKTEETADQVVAPEAARQRLEALCDASVPHYLPGRVVLAQHVSLLYRFMPAWTRMHLLPLFDWKQPEEARGMWMGLLHGGTFSPALLLSIGEPLWQCVGHYEALEGEGKNYALGLARLALEYCKETLTLDAATQKRLVQVMYQLPLPGLEAIAEELLERLKSHEGPSEYEWYGVMQRYVDVFWPKLKRLKTRTIILYLAELCLAADNAFPHAVQKLAPWLTVQCREEKEGAPVSGNGLPDSDVTLFGVAAQVRQLQGKGYGRRFPEAALIWLDKMAAVDWLAVKAGLAPCLDQIERAVNQQAGASLVLKKDARFIRLKALLS